MKKYIVLILCLFVSLFSVAQENIKNFDFIITIDEEIATTLSNPAILLKQDANILKKIDVNYYPGNLSLNTEDYNMIFSKQEITLYFKFDYYEYSNKVKQNVYNYEIEIGENWFEQSFVILKIYNTSKKKYKKRFNALSSDKDYTFELATSSGQMLRTKE